MTCDVRWFRFRHSGLFRADATKMTRPIGGCESRTSSTYNSIPQQHSEFHECTRVRDPPAQSEDDRTLALEEASKNLTWCAAIHVDLIEALLVEFLLFCFAVFRSYQELARSSTSRRAAYRWCWVYLVIAQSRRCSF